MAAEEDKHLLLDLEESDLTDLSSDTSPESRHRCYSSNSQDDGSEAERIYDSNYRHSDKTTPSTVSPRKHSTVSDRERLQKHAIRISLTRRRPLKREMGREELKRLLTAAHNDLDKLVQYTMIVSEENTALKEIMKTAVIVSEDGTIGDYSDILISKDRELPILNGLSHHSYRNTSPSAFSGQYELPSSHQNHDKEVSISTQPVAIATSEQSEPIVKHSTDSNSLQSKSMPSLRVEEAETESSIQRSFSDYSSSLRNPTIAENFTEAVAGQTNLDSQNATRSLRPEYSIKKLQLLTASCRESESEHRRRSKRKKRKSLKLSDKEKSLQKISSDVSTISELDESEIMQKKPKFFTSDMLCVIMERNELKERIHQLEENVQQLENELKEAKEDQEAAALWENEGTEGIQRRTNFFRRNTIIRNRKSVLESEKFISSVLVIGYKKRDGAYVYVIHTTWSDGLRFEIYRRYGEFFTFHNRLHQLFQAETGKIKSADKALPTLPSIDNVLSLFGRTNNESVVRQRLGTINKYCQILLCELDAIISRNEFVLGFFKPQPGDKQLQTLTRDRRDSELELSILSVYPQHTPSGSTFEEYIAMADYEATLETGVSVKTGDVVKVISREATGWWLVSSPASEGSEEKVGYVPGDFLKKHSPATSGNGQEDSISPYLGFVCPAALTESSQLVEEVDPAMKYVAIEDYSPDDPRQLCLSEGAQVIVIEKSEDGWWLVAAGDRQGWAPASFLELADRRMHPEGENLVMSLKSLNAISGEEYVSKAAFEGQCEEDVSFPEKATLEVTEKSISGWWMVRYKGKVGLAPASMLAVSETQLNVPQECKFSLTVDLGQGVSGILQPPPRSKRFLLASQSYLRQRSSTNTEENEFKSALVDDLPNSTSDSDNSSDSESKHTSMRRHVRKRVITNQRRKRNFKTFVRPNEINPKHPSAKKKMSTMPASFIKRSWGGKKKLSFQGMEAFVVKPRSQSTSEQSMKPADSLQEDALALLDPLVEERSATIRIEEGLERKTHCMDNSSKTLLEHTCDAKFNETC